MNILFFGKKRHGSGSHEYQRHVIRNLPVIGTHLYGQKVMMDNHTYFFDRFNDMGHAVFVDDQWDEEPEPRIQYTVVNGVLAFDEDRMADDGCPCHKN